MRLAIFDLDNTLISGDSDHSWGEYLIQIGAVDAIAYKKANDEYLRAYENGTLDINDYLAFSLQPLAQHPRQQLDEWHKGFMSTIIEPMILSKGEELIKKHRDAGDYLLIITATNHFVTAPIAKRLGVDDIIAIDIEEKDGQYTGRVSGIPSFREGKVTRLKAWLEAHPELSLKDACFYSDSRNDLPLLEMVDHPVAVDPDPELELIAKQRHWNIMSLR